MKKPQMKYRVVVAGALVLISSSATAQEDDEIPEERVETVLITQEKIAKIGGAAHRVSEEELKRTDYANPESVVQQVPGVVVRGEDGFGLRPNIGIRGANSDRSKKVALMEDGVLFGPAPYSAPAAYYFPQIGRMVGVEVFKGPGSVQYGPNTMGGALNLITRPIPYKLSGGIKAEAGQYFTGRGHGWLGASTDWGGFVAEGFHIQSDGFKELDGGGDTGFNRQEFMLKGSLNTDYSAEHFHRLNAKIGWSREHSNETYLGLSDDDFAKNPRRRYAASALDEMNWVRSQLQLRHTWEWGDAFSVESTLYRHDLRREWFKLNRMGEGTPIFDILNDPTGRRQVLYEVLTGQEDSLDPSENLFVGTNDRRYISQGLQTKARWKTEGEGWANVLEAGLRLHNDSIERYHTELGHRMESGRLVRDGELLLNTQNVGETYALAIHVLEQFTFWKLTLTPGARLELFEQTLTDELANTEVVGDQVVLVPGMGASFEVVDKLSVLGGVHRGFSPTSPGQASDVSSETSINYEAGVRYSDARKRRLIEAVGFFNDYSNLLGECTFSAGCDETQLDDQFNAGAVEVWGVEVAGHWAFEAGAFTIPLRATYTLIQSEFQSAFNSENPQFGEVEVGDELPYTPEHQASMQLGLEWEALSFYATGTWVSAMRETAGQSEDDLMTDEQLTLDLNAGWRFEEGFSVTARAENITNDTGIASRRPFGARPHRPMLIMLGAGYEF